MAASINKIKLKNFKAFYGDEEIKLEGKHLLLYGENGSGKSSIYWALYTLLQSATKDNSQIDKYFIPNNDEHLINHDFLKEHHSFAVDANGKITDPQTIGINASVKIELTNSNSATIDSTGKTDHSNILENLNQYSDFISHRLLINFYNFRNSKQINLWEVFVRDIFPFLLTAAGDETLGQILKDIETNKPFYNFTGNTFKLRTKKSNIRKDYVKRIKLLNDNLDRWITDINGLVDTFYNTHFREANEPKLRIVLDYNVKLVFDDIFQERDHGNNTHYMWSKKHVDLNNPFIKLNISQQDQNGNWVLLEKPQSYFNEAKLTQIALSVRFSLLDDSIRPEYEGQFLALDDLLVSLDMANRDKVLDIILNEFAPRYKIYLFTHERAFFNLVNQRLVLYNLKEDWKVKEMFMNSTTLPQRPILVDDSDYLSKANQALNSFDLPACANSLRKECEQSLKRILPKNLSITFSKDGTANFKQLNDLIAAFDKFYKEKLEQTDRRYAKLNQYKTFILNPLSHDNLDSEYYFKELKEAITLLNDLRTLKIKKSLDSDTKLFYKQIDHTGTEWIYEIILRENLLVYQLPDSTIKIPNLKCTGMGRTDGNTTDTFCTDYKLKDFPEMAHRHSNQGNDPANAIDYLDVLEDEDNLILRVKLGL